MRDFVETIEDCVASGFRSQPLHDLNSRSERIVVLGSPHVGLKSLEKFFCRRIESKVIPGNSRRTAERFRGIFLEVWH
jgi:hypothetical protein